MSAALSRLEAFLAAWPEVALVEVREAKGSTPREAGAWMLVSPGAIFGTIGGGQLEFMAIGEARELLKKAAEAGRQVRGGDEGEENGAILDIPLGPEIGQCCGGRVEVGIALADDELRAAALARIEDETAARPSVFVFGGGHVGHALADALSLLPLRVVIVETRADQIGALPEGIGTTLTAVPEDVVRDAPAGAAFLVLTHDHALDFLIVAEALKRGDAAYVGMIGSKTKRATFSSWYVKEAGGDEARLSRLVCPIGGAEVKDKRPAVIAAMAAAELMRALTSW